MFPKSILTSTNVDSKLCLNVQFSSEISLDMVFRPSYFHSIKSVLIPFPSFDVAIIIFCLLFVD